MKPVANEHQRTSRYSNGRALVVGLIALGAWAVQALAHDAPVLQQSHAWIVVSPGAPERTALEDAGFLVSPIVSRHDGQGTASISVEFRNGYFELIYPDSTVSVSPNLQAGAEKFRLKSRWRETGYSPIGIVFDRTPATPDSFPFPTWKVTADWMDPGTFIEILTPKATPKALSISISSHTRSARDEAAALAKDPKMKGMFLHPNGARSLTSFKVVAPNADLLPPAAAYVQKQGLMKFEVGDGWVLEMTIDNGAQKVTKDLRPRLPLVVHY
jgi:hypothetical protein